MENNGENKVKEKKHEAPDYTRREFLALAGMGVAFAGMVGLIGKSVVMNFTEAATFFPVSGTETWATSVCQICPSGCGLDVRRIGENVVKVEGNPLHRLNHGRLCPKSQASTQVLYDPDRLRGPMQRVGERGAGQWETITWEEARARVAGELGELQAVGDAHTLLFLKGNSPGHMGQLIDRFCQAYGTPNIATMGSQCTSAEKASHLLNQGWYDTSAYDWEKTRYAIFFGGSFLEDWQPQVQMLSAYSFMRRGRPESRGRIIQVGSRLSVSGNKADEWIPIKPGMEGALALGLTHVIIKENQHDLAFIEEHTSGFEEFATLVLEEYSPEAVSGITGVPADTIKRLAREFAASRPSIAAAGQGLGISTNALYNNTAINALNAVVGNIDVKGGVLKQRYPTYTEWPEATLAEIEQPRIDGAGGAAHPLANCVYHELPDHILSDDPYPVNALFIYDSNPAFDSPGATRWQEALAKVPFIVSFASIEDESATYADLLLPDHTYLERLMDVTPPAGMGRAMVGLASAVSPPLYNTRHTGDFLLEIASDLEGMAEALPWANFEEMVKYRFEGIYNSGQGSIQAESFDEFWETLSEKGVWEGPRYPYGKWDEVLTTASGGFEFRMDYLAEIVGISDDDSDDESDSSAAAVEAMLASLGIEAGAEIALLPHHEAPVVSGDAQEYPLQLIPYVVLPDSANRAQNAPLLWNIYGLLMREGWGNWAELNPETAHAAGIEDGEMIWVESPEGKIQIKARFYDGALPDAVNIPLGGGHTAGGRWASAVRGANPTEIVTPLSDPLAGSAAWLGTRAKVYKAEGNGQS